MGKALAEALVANNTLVELSLRGNDLGDEGVEALATALMVGGGWDTVLDPSSSAAIVSEQSLQWYIDRGVRWGTSEANLAVERGKAGLSGEGRGRGAT